jgi:hypothetical protein
MRGTFRMAATVWTDINRNAIDVVEKMVVAIEPRDLFGGPDRKHFWASPKDLFNAIPIDLIK